MKIFLGIIAGVAGYSLLETFLLLSSIRPVRWNSDHAFYQTALFWSQLLLIPGIAAIFSCILHGANEWQRRVVKILAVGVVGLPAFIAFVIGLSFALQGAVEVHPLLAVALFLLVLAGVAAVLILSGRRTEKKRIELEANRWLRERQTKTPTYRKWRSRVIRCASAIPSVIVLWFYLFVPQTWGLAAHLLRPGAARLNGYEIPVPATWIVRDQYDSDDLLRTDSWIAGLVGTGSVSFKLLNRNLTISDWNFRVKSYGNPQKEMEARETIHPQHPIERNVIFIGNETVTCLEYGLYKSIIAVYCYGSKNLYADFTGDAINLPSFYKVLAGIHRDL
jgi:hypothetical protein